MVTACLPTRSSPTAEVRPSFHLVQGLPALPRFLNSEQSVAADTNLQVVAQPGAARLSSTDSTSPHASGTTGNTSTTHAKTPPSALFRSSVNYRDRMVLKRHTSSSNSSVITALSSDRTDQIHNDRVLFVSFSRNSRMMSNKNGGRLVPIGGDGRS